jgi:hypothetical protein
MFRLASVIMQVMNEINVHPLCANFLRTSTGNKFCKTLVLSGLLCMLPVNITMLRKRKTYVCILIIARKKEKK